LNTPEELRMIEELEYKYLNKLDEVIRRNLNYIVERFASRFDTYEYWAPFYVTEKKRLTDLGIGAERVFWKVLAKEFSDWHPVSLFIGSNLFFEAQDAYIHIDVKTAFIDNIRDFGGLVEVGDAQTSYPMKEKHGSIEPFQPKIMPYYQVNKNGKISKKYALTYFIQIIYEKPELIIKKNLDRGPIVIILISMPNGLLYEIYGEKIVGYPKSYKTKEGKRVRPLNYRFYYNKCPCFKLLVNYPCNFRVRLYFNYKYQGYQREGLSERVAPQLILKFEKTQNLMSKYGCNSKDNCYIVIFNK